MKVTIDIDCTPEEARRFMGLPDLAPVHEVYVQQLTRMMGEGITPDAVQSMVKTWMPASDAGMAMWRQLMDQMGSAGSRS